MLKTKLLLCLAASVLSVSVHAAGVPSADMDKITLSFINSKIYQAGAVNCRDKEIGKRIYVGCQNRKIGSSSQLSLWLYEGGVFKSVNGTARGFAEGRLAHQKHIAVMPLPLPDDVDIGSAMAAFN